MTSKPSHFKAFWRTYVLLLAPILFGLVFLNDNPEDLQAMKCAYVLLLMATYWVFEVLPVAVVALIPIAVFPFLGILSTVRRFK